MKARDERLKLTSDLLSSIRLVKMSAWEEAYQNKTEQARTVELVPLFGLNLIDGVLDCLYSASGSVVRMMIKYY